MSQPFHTQAVKEQEVFKGTFADFAQWDFYDMDGRLLRSRFVKTANRSAYPDDLPEGKGFDVPAGSPG